MVKEFPHQVRIENTNLCNAFCKICPREQLSRSRGTMDIEFFKSIINQLAAGGTKELHLQGYGEPFMDKEIFDKIRFAKSVKIPYTFMVTNASLLDDAVSEELLNTGLDKLKISFYGVDKTEYEAVHNGLSYDDVRKNVKRLLKAKKKLRKRKPVISLKYIGKPYKFLIFASQWGLTASISYTRLHNYAYGKRFNAPKMSKKNRKCSMVNKSIMQVLWNGLVVPCCYDFDGKIDLGDLKKESVSEIWNGEKYNMFRQLHKNRDYESIPVCLNCDKLR